MKPYTLSLLTLYYLLIKIDGNISQEEIITIYDLMEDHNLSKEYIDSVIDILEKSKDINSYKIAIDKLNKCDTIDKKILIKNLKKIANSDGQYTADEIEFIKDVEHKILN